MTETFIFHAILTALNYPFLDYRTEIITLTSNYSREKVIYNQIGLSQKSLPQKGHRVDVRGEESTIVKTIHLPYESPLLPFLSALIYLLVSQVFKEISLSIKDQTAESIYHPIPTLISPMF